MTICPCVGGAASSKERAAACEVISDWDQESERNLGFVASIVIFISLISHNLCSRENKTCFRTPHT